MRFKALPVTGLEDVTLDLEQLSARAILDKTPNNFLQLLSTQKLQLELGVATIAWPGATNQSTPLVVSLAYTPVRVFATDNGGTHWCAIEATPVANGFSLSCWATDGTSAGSNSIAWAAFH